jgi:hypothetical protein
VIAYLCVGAPVMNTFISFSFSISLHFSDIINIYS